MTRRELLKAAACAPLTPGAWAARDGKVQTVLWPINPSELGSTLMHEHVLVDFVGADKVSPSRYDRKAAFTKALPFLKSIKAKGCRTFVECTPAYLGRDPELLQMLAKETGLHIVTNTGYYGAANDKHVPAHAYAEAADKIAQRWIDESEKGMDGTAVRPGFMKIGVDSGKLSDIDTKLIQAGIICHKYTGLRLHVHTGDEVAALNIFALLNDAKVDPAAYVWVHAQNAKDRKVHADLAKAGVWIELDGIGPKSAEAHVTAVVDLVKAGLGDHVLISQDAGWYHVGEPDGGNFRGFDYLYDEFLPALGKAGLNEEQVRKLMVANPAKALTPAVR